MSDGINHTCINRTDCMGMIRSRDQALAAVNLLVAKQDQEIDELKTELASVKEELANMKAERDYLQRQLDEVYS